MVALPKSNTNSDCVSPDFYWDDQGGLIINPNERISILYDPYSELMSQQQQVGLSK